MHLRSVTICFWIVFVFIQIFGKRWHLSFIRIETNWKRYDIVPRLHKSISLCEVVYLWMDVRYTYTNMCSWGTFMAWLRWWWLCTAHRKLPFGNLVLMGPEDTICFFLFPYQCILTFSLMKMQLLWHYFIKFWTDFIAKYCLNQFWMEKNLIICMCSFAVSILFISRSSLSIILLYYLRRVSFRLDMDWDAATDRTAI